MNSSINDRKRRFISLSKTKKLRRTQLINNSKNQRIIHLNENTSNLLIPKQDDQIKQNSSVVVSPIITSSDLIKKNFSTKLFKLVVPTSIKMLSNADSFSSALRIPTKIQLTKTLNISNKVDYPPTPTPIIDNSHPQINENTKNWSVPPTSELSPTSLTSSSPDDSSVELDRISSIKRRYRSLSFSCPILSHSNDKIKPIRLLYKSKSLSRIPNNSNKKLRSMSPVIKYSSIERLKKRRKDQQIYGKRLKIQPNKDEIIIQEILNEIIDQIETIDQIDSQTKGVSEAHQTVLRRSKKSIDNEKSLELIEKTIPTELIRQTSTPLSFHSIASSSIDDQLINSPHIFTDIVNELIKGAKGLDKLSCSLITFTNSIHNFIRLTNDKQNEKVDNLQNELEKKCSSQLNRAKIFCTKKIEYFLNKHSILSINEYINEITLIVKYFYLYVLFLNCRKQENEFESIINDLINGKLTFINDDFTSSILTTIINDFILTSTLVNDYLLSQPIIINQIEYSLPFIRNIEYENELLYKNDNSLNINPFQDLSQLEEYLNCCEHIPTSIPYYPVQQSSHSYMYNPNYTSAGQYYYPSSQSSEMIPYYYPPSYSNSQQMYSYNHPSSYYNPIQAYNEQYNYYYYNQQTSYNSTNDIPYRRINSNIQKKYSNPPPEDPSTIDSSF